MGPKTVPEPTLAFLEDGMMTEEQAFRIHKDHPEKVYGMDPL